MKRFKKRRVRNIVRAFTTLILIVVLSFTTVLAGDDEIDDLNGKIDDTKSKIEEAEATVESLKSEQASIARTIDEIDNKIEMYNGEAVEYEKQKELLQEKMDETEKELENVKAEEEAQYEAMKKRIKYAYEHGNVEYLDTVFASADMSDMINQSEYVDKVYQYDAKMLKELVRIRSKVEELQVTLDQQLAEVTQLEKQAQDSLAAAEILLNAKKKQVSNYQGEINKKEELIAKYNADMAAMEAQIDAIIKKREEEAARKRAEAAAAGQASADQVYYNGGALQWPVSGYSRISCGYGSANAITGRPHYGIDIPCPVGTPVHAAEAGVVAATGYNGSQGNYVLIDHGGGLYTIYMHNSGFAVGTGQTVARGQVIAYAGATGMATGSHCHIGVRMGGSYVNPLGFF